MRLYSNIAPDTVLTVDPGASGTTINVLSTAGWPSPSSGDTALGAIDYGLSTVEVFEYTGLTGTAFTGCTRGVDGTTAAMHAVGSTVRHVASAADLQAAVRYGEGVASALLANTWYSPSGLITYSTGGTATTGGIRDVQFLVPARTRFKAIATEIMTAAATGLVRLGIWKTAGNSKPGSLVLDAGTVSAAVVGVVQATIDVWLPRGLYHLSASAEVVNVATRVIGSYLPPSRLPVSAFATGTTAMGVCWQGSVSAGALPSTYPSGATIQTAAPMVWLQTY